GDDGVARAHRPEPADLVDPGRAHARHTMDEALDGETERHPDRLPATGDQSSVDRARGRGLVHVEGLRIVAPAEFDDLVTRERVRPERVGLSGLEVLEIERGHDPEGSSTRSRSTGEPAGFARDARRPFAGALEVLSGGDDALDLAPLRLSVAEDGFDGDDA